MVTTFSVGHAPDDVLPTMFGRIGWTYAALHNAVYAARGGLNVDKERYRLLGVPRPRPKVDRDMMYDGALLGTARRAALRADALVSKDQGKKLKNRTVVGKVLRDLEVRKAGK